MAAEAVLKVKQAEEQASEIVRRASDEAKELIRKAETEGRTRQKEVIAEANRMKAEMIDRAGKAAVSGCSDLLREGEAQKQKILNPEPQRFEQAVQIVIERIVNVNGYS